MRSLPVLLLIVVTALFGAVSPAGAATFVVDSAGDGPDAARDDGLCATTAGGCTLRAALETADRDGVRDRIDFALTPGAVIRPATALPAITEPLELDGADATGRPLVELDGSLLAPTITVPGPNSFVINPPHGLSADGADGIAIRGLIVHSFPGAQLHLQRLADATVAGNWLGLDAEGRLDRGREAPGAVDSAGILFSEVTQSRIGGELAHEANVVSGLERAIVVEGASSFVSVAGNRVGLTADGSGPVGNDHDGIAVGPRVGSSTRPSHVEIAANAIAATGFGSQAGGDGWAVRVAADDTTIAYNRIGFDGSGTEVRTFFDDPFGNRSAGVLLSGAVRTQVRHNQLAANNVGVLAHGARLDGLIVAGNTIGLTADGAGAADAHGHPTGHRGPGIWIDGGAGVTIGGPAAIDANVIGANRGSAIQLLGAMEAPVVENNTIATDRARTIALPDQLHAISVEPGESGDGPEGAQIRGNRIGGEPGHAVALFGGEDHVVAGNEVGLAADGSPLAGTSGVAVIDVPGVRVGGTAAADANAIVAMRGAGVTVTGDDAGGTRVEGNRVGFDRSGATRPGYGNGTGVAVEERGRLGAPGDVRVGGEQEVAGNLIGGDGEIGVRVSGRTTDGTLIGSNRIGADATGAPAPPRIGVHVDRAPGTQVGRPGAGNAIAGAGRYGVAVSGRATGRTVQANRIAPGDGDGSGDGAALLLDDAAAVVVGAPADRLLADDCASGECNVFGAGGRVAIAVTGDGAGNVLRGNRFTDPAAQPIDLGGDGPSALDARDLDDGPNHRLNQPTGLQEVWDPRTQRFLLTGVVESLRPRELTVELYGQDGDGQAGTEATLLGRVRPDSRGAFRLRLADGDRFHRYTALAQAADGTSEFARSCGFATTSPGLDSDRDGICDEWEVRGIDYDQDGRADFDPRGSVGARDVHVELDAMEHVAGAPGFDPMPEVRALERVTAPFATAPTGPIALHWAGEPGAVRGERVPAVAKISAGVRRPGAHDDLADYRWGSHDDPCDGWFGSSADRDDADGRCFARLGARGLVVRYFLSGREIDDVDGTQPGGVAAGDAAGMIGLGGISDLHAMALGGGSPLCLEPRSCQQVEFSYTLLHELGHTLGLPHDGSDSPDTIPRGTPYNPAHLSVMSYTYHSAWHANPLDFAATAGFEIDEGEIDEAFPFALRPADQARGWRPLLSAWRRIDGEWQCSPALVPRGQPVTLDDDPRHQRIAHSVNDGSGTGCLRPSILGREQHRGGEEWSRLQLSLGLGRNLFDDVERDPDVTSGSKAALRGGSSRPATGGEVDADPLSHAAAVRADLDGDGVAAVRDVCPGRDDPDQADANDDGIGDACVTDYVPSDLELALDAPRRFTYGADAEVRVHVTEAWPLPIGGATVAVTLPEGLEVVGSAGDGSYDAAGGRWSTGAFGVRERRTLRLTVRARADGEDGAIAAEIVAAAAEDVDSTPGDGSAEQDDRAVRDAELVPAVEPSRLDAVDVRVGEGTTTRRTLRFALRLEPVTEQSVSFRVRTGGGSATAGGDYVPVDRVVTLPAGRGDATVAVEVLPDDRVEGDETVELTVSELDGARPGRLTATGTLADDDMRVPGDLTAFGCIARPNLRDACALETLGFRHFNQVVALAGERDLYLSDGIAIAHLRRDPETEALTPAGCWRVRTRDGDVAAGGCDDLPEDEEGRLPFEAAHVGRLTAAPDGRHLYATLATHRIGYGVATFAIDPGDGTLSLVRCVGDPTLGPACSGGSGTVQWNERNWATTSIAPDGSSLTFVAGSQVSILRIGADGVAGSFRCGDSGAPSAATTCALRGDEGPLQRQAVSPDGTRLAVTGWDRLQLYARNPQTGTVTRQRSVTTPTGYGAPVWTPDGATLLVSSGKGAGAIVAYDPATLAPTGCIAGSGGPLPEGIDCATTAPVGIASAAGMRFSPDGRDLYAVGSSGGVFSFRHDGDGRLRYGRCTEPASGAGVCEGEDHVSGGYGLAEIVLDPAGDVAFAAAGTDEVNRYLRVQPPAPGGNRAPLCADAAAAGRPTGPIAVPLACADPDGDAVTMRITGAPEHGTVGEPAGGAVVYTPAPGFAGADAFRFRGSDGSAESPEATARLTIGNTAPTCGYDHFRVGGGTVTPLTLTCGDVDGDPLTFEVLAAPAKGRLAGSGTGTLRYVAPDGWSGRTSATVRASDGVAVSEAMTIDFDVDGATVPPPVPRARPQPRPRGDSSGSGSGGCRAPCTPGSDGAVEITVLCDGTSVRTGATCRGTLVIVMCSKGVCTRSRGSALAGAAAAPPKLLPSVKGVRLGQGQGRIRPGRRAKLRVKLTRAARRQLARRGSLKALVVVQVRQPDGRLVTDRTVITIRARRAPRRARR